MKKALFLTFLMFFMSLAVNAHAETIEEFANRYYGNCMAKEDATLGKDDQKMLCACTAAQVVKTMPLEGMQRLQEDSPQGQAFRNLMLTGVYAPCMEYPTRALLYKHCMEDPGVKGVLQNPDAICSCVGDDMGKYVAGNAPAIIKRSLEQNPNDLDPMNAFLTSPEYAEQSKTILFACLQKNGFGQKP